MYIRRLKIKFKIPSYTLCVYCKLNLATSWDHIIPYSKGGSDLIENLVPACKRCNSIAHNNLFRSIEEKRKFILGRLTSKLIVIPRYKIMLPSGISTLAKIIKSGKLHLSVGRRGRGNWVVSDPGILNPYPSYNTWYPATVDNALVLTLRSL